MSTATAVVADDRTLLTNASTALHAAGVDHGPLRAMRVPPSRNTFLTDDDAVFVKVASSASSSLDHEHLAARMLTRRGFPTPRPLGTPVTVQPLGLTFAPYERVEASTAAVTSREHAALLARLWAEFAPRPTDSGDWRLLLDRTRRNLEHVADPVASADLSSLLDVASRGVVRAAAQTQPRLVFSHGDPHYRNAMRSADHTALLIDWELGGAWWPEMEVAKYVQTLAGEPFANDHHANDLDLTGFLDVADAGVPGGLNEHLLEACVRLRAANALTYQTRWGVGEHFPAWPQRCLAIAEGGLDAARRLAGSPR